MKKRNLVITLLLFALVLFANIKPAMAYFTTYVRVQGGYPVSVGDTTTVEEEFSNWTKHVTIKNQKGSEPVFIRAKVIYKGLGGKDGYTAQGNGWTAQQSDGYYYYGKSASSLTAVEGGASTAPLNVKITNLPKTPKESDTFSVTVVYESTPVRYNADKQAYADWNAEIIDIGSTTGGNGS